MQGAQSNYLPQCGFCEGLWPTELHVHAYARVRACMCERVCVCACAYVSACVVYLFVRFCVRVRVYAYV